MVVPAFVLLRFSRRFVLVRVGYLSISEAYTNNWSLFGKENYLAFDWWKHFLLILRCSEVTINLTRPLKKMQASKFLPLLYYIVVVFSDAPSPCGFNKFTGYFLAYLKFKQMTGASFNNVNTNIWKAKKLLTIWIHEMSEKIYFWIKLNDKNVTRHKRLHAAEQFKIFPQRQYTSGLTKHCLASVDNTQPAFFTVL